MTCRPTGRVCQPGRKFQGTGRESALKVGQTRPGRPAGHGWQPAILPHRAGPKWRSSHLRMPCEQPAPGIPPHRSPARKGAIEEVALQGISEFFVSRGQTNREGRVTEQVSRSLALTRLRFSGRNCAWRIMPAPAVPLVSGSIRMKLPVDTAARIRIEEEGSLRFDGDYADFVQPSSAA